MGTTFILERCRFALMSLRASILLMVVHRPVELAAVIGYVGTGTDLISVSAPSPFQQNARFVAFSRSRLHCHKDLARPRGSAIRA